MERRLDREVKDEEYLDSAWKYGSRACWRVTLRVRRNGKRRKEEEEEESSRKD